MLARWTSNLEICDNELVTEKVLCIDMRRVCPVCLILSVNELTVSTVNLTHVAAKTDKDKNDFISLILVASILSKSITLNRLMIHYLKKKAVENKLSFRA